MPEADAKGQWLPFDRPVDEASLAERIFGRRRGLDNPPGPSDVVKYLS
jgi:hypothetical protein